MTSQHPEWNCKPQRERGGEGEGETFAFLPLGIADALVMRKQTTIKEQKERNTEIRSNDLESRHGMQRGLRALLGTPWVVMRETQVGGGATVCFHSSLEAD